MAHVHEIVWHNWLLKAKGRISIADRMLFNSDDLNNAHALVVDGDKDILNAFLDENPTCGGLTLPHDFFVFAYDLTIGDMSIELRRCEREADFFKSTIGPNMGVEARTLYYD